MPCLDPYAEEEDRREQAEKISDLTRMLCGLCQTLEDNGLTEAFSRVDSLNDWWNEHQQIDAERLAAEAAEKKRRKLIESGLNKLSQAEREALGLD